MTDQTLCLLSAYIFGSGLLGYIAGATRGEGLGGALLGLLFGPFGAIVATAMQPSRAVLLQRERLLREVRRQLDDEERAPPSG